MPTKTNSLKLAPYSTGGSLWHYPTSGAVWLPNDPFRATLQIDQMHRGYSAKYVTWRPANAPDDRRTFPMFIADLLDLIQNADRIEHGILSARWLVRKRGQNYGLCLAPPLGD